MLPGHDRDSRRASAPDVWRGHHQGEALDTQERQLAEVIAEHAQYRPRLDDPYSIERDAFPEHSAANPFLHLGLRVARREQLASDHPPGVRAHSRRLLTGYPTAHQAEHAIMDCLGVCLYEAQRRGVAPDESAYLECVERLARRRR